MTAQVSSVFLYVSDVPRTVDFYTEVVGAEIRQLHAESEGGPLTLAILRLGDFTLMIHPQGQHEEDFRNQRMGLGIHLQIRVEDVDAFYQQCIDQGAILSVSGEPVDQEWGWREFALKDPDGFVWSVYQDKSGGRWT
jgi:uncharacterized glyoxalase superfamily protein PhnB